MKKIITAETIRSLLNQGQQTLSYCAETDLITPEAKDLIAAHHLTIETPSDDTSRVPNEKTKSPAKFCGIRPNFAVSDRALLYFRIIEMLRKQYPEDQTDDQTLQALIEPILERYLSQSSSI